MRIGYIRGNLKPEAVETTQNKKCNAVVIIFLEQ